MNNRLYAIGGYNDDGFSKLAEEFDLDKEKSTEIASLTIARWKCKIVTIPKVTKENKSLI